MEIFRPFVDRGPGRLQTLASSSSNADLIFTESFRQIKMLLILLATQFDPRLIPLQFLETLATICLETAKDVADNSESLKLFIVSYTILEKLAHSFPVLLTVIRLFMDRVRSMIPQMPSALERVFGVAQKHLRASHNAMNFPAEYPAVISELTRDLGSMNLNGMGEETNSSSS